MIRKFHNLWQGLSRRERVFSASATLVVVLGLIFSLGIEPAWKTRVRLEVDLPRLQSELVQLEALQVEIRGLQERGDGLQTRELMRAALAQSIGRAKMVGEVVNQGENAVAVSTRDVSAAKWFKWLESFAREARVQVVAARVERASAGKINASVAFGTAAANR